MNFAYPPLPTGEKIITSEVNGTIYPIFSDAKTIQQWNFGIIENGVLDKRTAIKLSDGDVNWTSRMSKISDSEGKERYVIFDDKKIYIIHENESKKIDLIQKPRVDKFVGKNAFFTISPLPHSEVISPPKELMSAPLLKPKIQARSFYCGYLKDEHTQDIILYDLFDDKFSINLPFKSVNKGALEVSLLSRVTSYKNSYVIFVTTEISPNNQYSVSLHAIKEKDLMQKSSSLTIKDFITSNLTSNSYPLNIYINHFYHDNRNTGSDQFLLCLGNQSADVISLQMFEIDDSPKIVAVASYDNKTNPENLVKFTPIRERRGLVSYAVTQNAAVFFLHNIVRDIHNIVLSGKSQKQFICSLNLDLIAFNHKNKKFEKQSSISKVGYVPLPYHENNNALYASDVQPNFSVDWRWMPWVNYASMLPKIKITKDKSKGLSILLEGVYISFRMIMVIWRDSYKLSDTQLASDYDYHGELTLPPANPLYKSMYVSISKGKFDKRDDNFLTDAKTVTSIGNVNLEVGAPMHFFSNTQLGLSFQEAADVTGDSVVLGSPNLSYSSNLTQITGFYRALPFQKELKKSAPMISVSSSKGTVTGITDSVTSNWQAGYDVSGTFPDPEDGLIVNAHFSQSFGGHNMTMRSDTKGISLHSVEDLSSYDLVTGYGAEFYLWEYPVYRKSINSEPFDFVTILIPIGYSQQSLDAKEKSLGYFQDYEIGSLLTYIGSELPGYSEKGLLFTPSTITATSDSQGGMSLTYDRNSSTSKEKSTSTDTSINASLGLNLFGVVNIGGHYTHSESHNTSTHTTQTLDYSITFHSGTVSDSQYEYKLTPLVYRHKDSKALVTTCRVELDGLSEGWKKMFSNYDVRLMRTFPDTENKTLRAFSRCIRFTEQADNTIDINLHLFNNSLYSAQNIKCEIYLGQANFEAKSIDVSKLKHLGTLALGSMGAVERKIVTLKKLKLPKIFYITVKISVDDIPELSKYFWGTYPYNHANSVINLILAQIREGEQSND